MAKKRPLAKNGEVSLAKLDLDSPATAEKFRHAATIYTTKSKRSKEAAIETLKHERFLTRTGKVARVYAAKA